jgi:hypothetical protein
MAAILGASLSFFACEQDAKTDTVYLPSEMIHLDVMVGGDGLADALLEEGDLVIGLSSETAVELSAALTIPDGKVVYILNGTTLKTAVSNLDLTVEGIVYVGIGATLDTSAGVVKVPKDKEGRVYVIGSTIAGVADGTLKVKDKTSVTDGADEPKTVLGTDKVSVGGTLAVGTTTAVADVPDLMGYVGSRGTVDASASTAITALLPSAAVKISPAGKKLVIAANGAEDQTTLTIPAGLDLTTSDDLDTVATLTVAAGGSLTASDATLKSEGATITVNGTATLGTVAKVLKDSSATGVLTATIAALGADATLAVGAGSAVNKVTFPGAATVSAIATDSKGLTIGSLAVPAKGTLVIAADTTLTVAAGSTLTVDDGGAVTLTKGSNPGILVLSNKKGTAAAGGGGKLVLTGGGDALGTKGAIQPAATVTTANLTATNSTAKAFTLAGASGDLSSIDNIASSAKSFTSIEAATVAEGDVGTNGSVVFKAAESTDGTLDKAATLQCTG